jgi:hypothetical protein
MKRAMKRILLMCFVVALHSRRFQVVPAPVKIQRVNQRLQVRDPRVGGDPRARGDGKIRICSLTSPGTHSQRNGRFRFTQVLYEEGSEP